MSLHRTAYARSENYLRYMERDVALRLCSGWALVGASMRKGSFIDALDERVVEHCLEKNVIVAVSSKPTKYDLGDYGRSLL